MSESNSTVSPLYIILNFVGVACILWSADFREYHTYAVIGGILLLGVINIPKLFKH